MPKRAAISATGMSAVLSKARMVLTSFGDSFTGRPPFRPRARAAVKPGDGALADPGAFELGQGGEDVEDEPPGWVLFFRINEVDLSR
jgi:hypothetical protein